MKNRLPDPGAPARERIGWIDLLRVIACFLVVFSHSCDPFVAVFDSDNPYRFFQKSNPKCTFCLIRYTVR